MPRAASAACAASGPVRTWRMTVNRRDPVTLASLDAAKNVRSFRCRFVLRVPSAYTSKTYQAPADGNNRWQTPVRTNSFDW